MRRGVVSVNIALRGVPSEEFLDMCDYSLHMVRTRPAKVGEKLITHDFGTGTRGFAAPEDCSVAVCLLPGTELALSVRWGSDWQTPHVVISSPEDEAAGYETNDASMHGRARVGDSPPGQCGRPLGSLSRSCMKARNNPGRDRSPTVPVQTAASPTRTGNEWSKTRITGSARDRSDPTTRNADLQAWDRIARP